MAGQIDLYYWDGDKITSLCTSDCLQASSDWMATVYAACNPTDTIPVDGKLVPIETVGERYVDGVGLACLTDQ